MELNKSTTAFLACHWENDVVGADGAFAPFFRAEVERRGVIAVAKRAHRRRPRAPAPRSSTPASPSSRRPQRPGHQHPAARCRRPAGHACSTAPTPPRSSTSSSPRPTTGYVTNPKVSGFASSDLDERLRAAGIDTVVLFGVATNLSVESTGRSAGDLGYRVIVVEDACCAPPTKAPTTRPSPASASSVRSPPPTTSSPPSDDRPPTPHDPPTYDPTSRQETPMTDMLAARLHEIGEPMKLERVPLPRAAPHRRRRPGHGLQRRAQPEERARHLRRVVPLPPAAAAAGDLRPRHRRCRHPGRRPGHRRRRRRPRLRQPRPLVRRLPRLPARRGPELRRVHVHGVLLLRPGRPAALRRLPLRRPRRVPDRPAAQPASSSPTRSASSRAPGSATSAPRYSALKQGQAPAPARPSWSTAISGTLGLGACLNALAMGATKIFGTGRNAELLADVKAIAPDRIEVHAVGDGALERVGPRAQRRRRRRHRHRRPRPRRPRGDAPRGPLHPGPRRRRSSTSAA